MQTVVITGNGGLGNSAAEKFLKEGWKVLHISKADKDQFKESRANGAYVFLTCDFSIAEQVSAAAEQVTSLQSELKAFVHTAVGEVKAKKFLELAPEDFANSFKVELFGGFVLLQAAAKLMAKNGEGSIVGISSTYTDSLSDHPALAGYISAKQALRGLLRQMAIELAPAHVRVNAVAPSFVAAGLNKDVPERMVEFMKEKNPSGLLPTPEQVSALIYFLCSKEAEALTGLHIPVSYGESMNL